MQIYVTDKLAIVTIMPRVYTLQTNTITYPRMCVFLNLLLDVKFKIF